MPTPRDRNIKRALSLAALLFLLLVGFALVEGREFRPISPESGRLLPHGRPDQATEVDLIAASGLIDRPVEDRQGQTIATLRSLLIDVMSNAVSTAIIERAADDSAVGSFVAVSWRSLEVASDPRQPIRTSLSRPMLSRQPHFQSLLLAAAATQKRLQNAAPAQAATRPGSPRQMEELNAFHPPPLLVPLDQIVGATVELALGPSPGRVGDVAIDLDHHEAAFALVPAPAEGRPGWLPIPVDALVWCRPNNSLIAIADPSLTSQAPRIAQTALPQRMRARDLALLDQAYGSLPSWWGNGPR